jgi:ligand-binding SRPBCC domain-containing protein
MKTLNFSININAPKENVWHKMLNPESFRVWTAEFCEGSYFEGSWIKGEKITPLANTMALPI